MNMYAVEIDGLTYTYPGAAQAHPAEYFPSD